MFNLSFSTYIITRSNYNPLNSYRNNSTDQVFRKLLVSKINFQKKKNSPLLIPKTFKSRPLKISALDDKLNFWKFNFSRSVHPFEISNISGLECRNVCKRASLIRAMDRNFDYLSPSLPPRDLWEWTHDARARKETDNCDYAQASYPLHAFDAF